MYIPRSLPLFPRSNFISKQSQSDQTQTEVIKILRKSKKMTKLFILKIMYWHWIYYPNFIQILIVANFDYLHWIFKNKEKRNSGNSDGLSKIRYCFNSVIWSTNLKIRSSLQYNALSNHFESLCETINVILLYSEHTMPHLCLYIM